jgi:hypothetical protein
VFRDEATEGPDEDGSTSAERIVFGFEITDFAWRGPMRPPPITAIFIGVNDILNVADASCVILLKELDGIVGVEVEVGNTNKQKKQ